MMPVSWSSTRPGSTCSTQSGRAVFDVDLVHSSTGAIDLVVSGPEAALKPLLQESGGHRWQRVPPTERRDRVHTSTVTVVALPIVEKASWALRDADLEITTMRGSGAGGQHRNRTESAVRMRHLPSGLEVRICSERSQHRNKDIAREILEGRVRAHYSGAVTRDRDAQRKELAGSGMRGDKRRTYRVKDDQVQDHITGRKAPLRRVLAGELGLLS
jgi:peptide chain release factor 1